MLDYEAVRNWTFPELSQSYSEKDCMLYALAIGLGHDPLDPGQLQFVYERNLKVVPTMPVVLGWPGFWMKNPATGIDWVRIMHGEQAITIHRPMAPAGDLLCRTRVTRVVDKGEGRGALVYLERCNIDKATGDLLTTIEYTIFCRGDGGFGKGDEATASPPASPEGSPDVVCDLATLPQQALMYRLCADRAEHHADPEAARAAGFSRPFLHGLCTYGVAGHAILRTYCGYEPARLTGLSARFSAPVFPGETIRTEMWRQSKRVLFRSRVLERGSIVLSHGVATIESD